MDNGVAIPKSHVDHHSELRNPDVSYKRARMDLKANRKRAILATDLVHESVTRRVKADTFPANKPPKGLRITVDSGKPLGRLFA